MVSEVLEPVYSNEAEVAVLGCMMESSETIPVAQELLSVTDFYDSRNKEIASVIYSIFDLGLPVDIVSVTNELQKRNEFHNIGGTQYLVSLSNMVSAPSSIKYYADIVHKHAEVRRLRSALVEIIELKDADEIIERANLLVSSSAKSKTGGSLSMQTTMINAINRYDDIASGRIKPIQTADYNVFNNKFWIEPGELTIIGGQPGQGKTLFAFELCQSLARNGHNVFYLSLEMTEVELAYRLLSFKANVPLNLLRRGKLDQIQLGRLINASHALEKYPIRIDPQPGLTVSQAYYKICAAARSGADIVFLDHIHQMSPDSRELKDHHFYERVSNMLRAVAKEKGIVVFGISQLNKSAGQRKEGPAMEDLRESGALMQDAQNIWMVTKDIDNIEGSRQLVLNIKSVKARSDINHEYKIGFDFNKGSTFEFEDHETQMNGGLYGKQN